MNLSFGNMKIHEIQDFVNHNIKIYVDIFVIFNEFVIYKSNEKSHVKQVEKIRLFNRISVKKF